MTATFQRGNQRRTNSRFLKAVTRLALCAATVSSAGCAQDPMAGSVASTAASDLPGGRVASGAASASNVDVRYPDPRISGGTGR
jgi:hypothetical protein